jgi:hypothetical protein
MLVRRLMFTGLTLCFTVVSGAWVTSLLGA